jgi:O-antigen ligase
VEKSQAGGDRRLRSSWIVCLLVALSPALMAITTWTPGGYFSVPLFYWRFFAPPVVAVELLAIGMAWAAGFRPLAAARALPGWIGAILGALVLIDVGDALFVAHDRPTATMRSTMTLIHLLFGLGVVHLLGVRRFDAYRALWWSLLAGAVLYVALLIAYVAAIAHPDRFDWQHFGLGVVNIRHAGFYVTVGAAMAFAIAATEPRRHLYWLAVAAATLCCAELFWSGSRSPLLALLAASMISAALIPVLRNWKLPAALSVAYVAGGALSLLHLPPHPHYGLLRMLISGSEKTANAVASGRIDLWWGAIRALRAHPIFGYGEGQFIIAVPEAQHIYHHPHNMLLQSMVQWGVVGAFLLAVLGVATWWSLYRATRTSGDRAVPAFVAVNGFAVYAMFDGVFFFVYPMMIVAFLLAAGLAAGRTSPASV